MLWKESGLGLAYGKEEESFRLVRERSVDYNVGKKE